MIRIAFAGLRHNHIITLYNMAKNHSEIQVVGAWEEDPQVAAEMAKMITEPFYNSYEQLLADPQVDVVAIGDYYGIRGQRILQALSAGCAVIADKPLCTDLAELDRIVALSREKQLPVGCMLDLRDHGAFRRAAQLIREGEIGTVRAVSFTAQHPLNYGVRPNWYFEVGKHGGTFNDIAIHGLDAVAWLTGSAYIDTLYARQWNAYATEVPHFSDSALFHGLLENGAAVSGDVSYAAPNGAGFALPSYWRFTVWGSNGWLECRLGDTEVLLAHAGDTKPASIAGEAVTDTILDAFLTEVRAKCVGTNSESVFSASYAALRLQQFADNHPLS